MTVTAAAPALAASQFASDACPIVPIGTQWAVTTSGANSGGGAHGWAGTPSAFEVSDNATTTSQWTVTTTATITGLVPGQSYPFHLLIRANYANDSFPTGSRATVTVTIDGTQYFQAVTRGTGTLLSISNSTQHTYFQYAPTQTFVATGTSATLTYSITADARTGGQPGSDDIGIQAPVWTNCSTGGTPLIACPAPMAAFPNTVTNGAGASGSGDILWSNQGGNPNTASGTLPDWQVSRDSAAGRSLIAVTSGTMTNLVPGQTYTVAFNIKAGFGANNRAGSSHSIMRVNVGGTVDSTATVTGGTYILNTDTRSPADGGISGFTVLNTGDGLYHQYRATFVANGTTERILYVFQGSQTPTQISGDDIWITAPKFINCA